MTEFEFDRKVEKYKGTEDEAKAEVEYWKHKYRSQCSKMGNYKAEVAADVRERERILKNKEQELRRQRLELENKEEFLKNTDYETLRKEKLEILENKRKVEDIDKENRNQLYEDFEEIKKEIIKQLDDEFIRWTEEYGIDNQRSQGYVIGIDKAKKIIRENMKFKLKNNPLRKTIILGEFR